MHQNPLARAVRNLVSFRFLPCSTLSLQDVLMKSQETERMQK